MAYLNLTADLLALAHTQGVAPRAFFEARLALWQHDYGTDEWPEKINVTRRHTQSVTAYELAVVAVFDGLNQER